MLSASSQTDIKEATLTSFQKGAITRALRLKAREIEFIDNPDFHNAKKAESFIRPFDPADNLGRKPRAGLLSKAEERHLFRQYNCLKYLAAKEQRKLSTENPDTAAMLRMERCLNTATEVRNKIISANVRLVVSTVSKQGIGHDFDERVSDGNLSLMRAVEKFDYARGFTFGTYGTWAIKKNSHREFSNEVKQISRFTPTDLQGDEFVAIHAKGDELEDRRLERAARNAVRKLLTALPEREQLVVRRRFGLGKGDELTLLETGHEIGVTRERTRQIQRAALNAMAKHAESLSHREQIGLLELLEEIPD